MIGPGDSGKSTILQAIEWALWPSWNLVATDTDFYNCATDSHIVIQLSMTELPEALMKEDTYGLYLRDYGMVLLGREDDEPRDGLPQVLTIRLTIDASLEPKWEIVTNRAEPKPISHKDRKLLTLGVVGSDHEKDFQWGRNSILQKYTDSRAALHNAFTTAMRNAVAGTTLEALDTVSPIIAGVGEKFGVAFNGQLRNKLLMQNGSYSSTVGVFDDNVPFAQRGLGSKRLLSIGMNVNTYDNSSVILVDELETGLEPYRISALINELRKQFKDSGQVIMTTHSRSVVCECTVDELAVVHASGGEICFSALNTVESIKSNVQGLIRREPDSFLCKRVIVCEGKTEVGLLRAFDDYPLRETDSRLAFYGVGIALGGGGNNFFELAKLLKECGYDTCILMDSDIASEEKQKIEAMSLGIPVFSWEAGYAIEEQLFKDASVSCAEDLTHTNAGVSVLTQRLTRNKTDKDKYTLSTISAFCMKWCNAYPNTAGIDDKLSVLDNRYYDDRHNGARHIFSHPWAREILQRTYSHVIVDEYQDCVIAQHKIFLEINNQIPVYVLGDPMQSIFGWAGKLVSWASIEFENLKIDTYPWRWEKTNKKLGKYLFHVRSILEPALHGAIVQMPIEPEDNCIMVVSTDYAHSAPFLAELQKYDTILYLAKSVDTQQSFARCSGGMFQNDEPQNLKDLYVNSRKLDSGDGFICANTIYAFIACCATQVTAELGSYERHIMNGDFDFSRIKKHLEFGRRMIAVKQTPSYDTMLSLLEWIQGTPTFRLCRKELFDELCRSIRYARDNGTSILEAAQQIRTIPVSNTKYNCFKRLASRTVLSKGLEFDCVVIDTSGRYNYSATDMYVAMTRAKQMIYFISNTKSITLSVPSGL